MAWNSFACSTRPGRSCHQNLNRLIYRLVVVSLVGIFWVGDPSPVDPSSANTNRALFDYYREGEYLKIDK
ncbi:MAG: hypothetical protein ACKO85_06015, partial [Isosphaeraceae bacterium]